MSSRKHLVGVAIVMAIAAVGRPSVMQAGDAGDDRYPVPGAAEEKKALASLRSRYPGAFKLGGMPRRPPCRE